MSWAIATPLSWDRFLSAVQNSGSSDTLVRCPAIEIDRLMGLFFAVKRLDATSRRRRCPELGPVKTRVVFLPRQYARRLSLRRLAEPEAILVAEFRRDRTGPRFARASKVYDLTHGPSLFAEGVDGHDLRLGRIGGR